MNNDQIFPQELERAAGGRGSLAGYAINGNCAGCGECSEYCPTGAITVDNFRAHIDYDKCIACDKCIDKCPRHIIWSGETQGKLGLIITRERI